jgi:hypothetical protein
LGPGTMVFDISRDPINHLFADSRIVTLFGTRVNGQCEGTVTLERVPGGLPPAVVEIAANQTNCEQLLKIGHLIHSPSAYSSSRNGPTPADPTGTGHAGFITGWFDPGGQEVTQVWDHVDWTYVYGVTINSCSGYDNLWWFAPTGWQVWSSSLSYYSSGYQCNVGTYADFRNYPFCNGVLTEAIYNKNNVWGNIWGTASGSASTWVQGSSCASWLHSSSWME